MENTKQEECELPLLLSVGCLNVDLICSVTALPSRGRRTMSHGIRRTMGGMAANVACVAAGLGRPWLMDVELIARTGTDGEANWVAQQLEQRGVSIDGITRDSQSQTCRCIILVEPDGERTIVSEPSRISTHMLKRRINLAHEYRDKKHLHVDGFHAPTVIELFGDAHKHGWSTSMDMDELPAPCLQADRFHELAQVFDVILVNRNSAKTLTQCPDIDSICAALWILASQLDTIFLLTLGSEGVRVLDPKSNLVVVPAVAAEAIDTTGAGDVFAGVFLSCWLHGLSVVDAAQKGNLAGALATQALGALGCIPRAIDL